MMDDEATAQWNQRTYMDLVLPATHSLVGEDLGEGYCQPLSEESLASLAAQIRPYNTETKTSTASFKRKWHKN